MTPGDSLGKPLLEVHELDVAYRSVSALARISLSLPAGAVVAVGGGSGSGKTTLLRAVSGLLSMHGGRVTGGRIELEGGSLVGRPPAAIVGLGVAHVLEGRRVFRDLTVEENLRAGGFPVRDRGDRRAGVERVLDRFPLLARRRTTPAGYLSGGEQQLLVLGRALVASPRLLLLDEPALGLAPGAIELVAEAVDGVARSGAGVLVAERRAEGLGDAGALAAACAASTVVLDARSGASTAVLGARATASAPGP